ncbi:MAG TPA: zinc ribbon domain-containing protein [Candidatus Acidoferrales bacterium]|nr:zinc ribbon domain-containing protein [Candidatus Acidoferrales bacterium]
MSTAVRDTKTTLKAELGIIHPVAWLVAGAFLLFWFLVPMPFLYGSARPGPGEPPLWVLAALLSFAGLVLGLWVLMVFYVNADAKRRQMNRLLWTLLVIFIPNAIGFIVYFLLRKPIARPCPKCRAPIQPDFVFCPACGFELAPKCPSCHKAVESAWVACAFCGAKLS